MNISSSTGSAQVTAATEQGGDYGVAVALKVKDQIKQQGAAAVKLIDAVAVPQTDATRGNNLSAYA